VLLPQVEFGCVGFRTNRKLCKTPAEHLAGQPSIKMWTVDKELGGWSAAQRKFFDAGQVLDEIQADVGARKMEARKASKK
jgi:ABC-type sulfate transport system substrate-binding protein